VYFPSLLDIKHLANLGVLELTVAAYDLSYNFNFDNYGEYCSDSDSMMMGFA
jgi:hypothetical protein